MSLLSIVKMEGHYKVYPTSVKLLQKHTFYSLNEFVTFINTWENQQFCDQYFYRDIRHSFSQLVKTRAKFGKNIRFSEDFYVHIECGNMKSLIEQFWNTLNVVNELIDSKTTGQSVCTFEFIMSLSYAKQSYDAAFTKLAAIVKSIDITQLKENGIYCQETFEEKYGLTWVRSGDT